MHSCVVLHAIEAQPLGAHAIHSELRRLLDEDNDATLDLPDSVIEDIKGDARETFGAAATTKIVNGRS